MDATPGLAEAGNEFYSVAGAARLGELLPTFSRGKAIVGVCGAPFKCPPAPSEAALLLHDYLSARGVRSECEISFVIPLPSPVPPSPDTSRALPAAFAERDIEFIPDCRVSSLDAPRPSRCSTTGARCRLTSSSACPNTARPMSCWPAG
jgi:sulfide:quinone oxidoreductase